MVQKLSVQISLEGGKEIERQLEGIGDAGKEAWDKIAESAKEAGGFKDLNLDEVTKSLEEMGITGEAAIGKIQAALASAIRTEKMVAGIKAVEDGLGGVGKEISKLTRLSGQIGRVADQFGPIGQAAGVAATAVAGLVRAAAFVGPIGAAIGAVALAMTLASKAALAWADGISKADAEAIKLGISIEKFSQLRQGLEKIGLSAETAASGIATIAKNLEALDVGRVKQAFEAAEEGAGLGSRAMKILQTATEGTGKAADDARVAYAKLADAQRQKGLQDNLTATEKAAEKAREALAKLGSGAPGRAAELKRLSEGAEKAREALTKLGGAPVAVSTPGLAAEFKRLSAAAENATLNVERARQALDEFKPQPAPLTGAAAAFERLGIAAGNVSQRLPGTVAALAKLPDTAQRSADALLLFGDAAGTELVQALRTGGVAIDAFIVKQGQMTQAQANEAAKTQQTLNQLSAEWNKFKADVVAPIAMPMLRFLRSELEGLRAGIKTTITEFERLGAFLTSLGNLGADSFWFKLGDAIVRAAGVVGDFIGRIASITWDVISGLGVAAWNALTGAIQKAIDAVLQFIGLNPSAPAGATSAPGKAGGGLIGGRGTGTSDSNLAWVSRGEHIMPARAVRQPGVLAFLEALRRGGGDLSRVLDRMGHFASGGLVTMPAFASGGLGGMHPVTIQFPGLAPISGLRASAGVVNELQRAAAMAQVRSGGRKPSRYT